MPRKYAFRYNHINKSVIIFMCTTWSVHSGEPMQMTRILEWVLEYAPNAHVVLSVPNDPDESTEMLDDFEAVTGLRSVIIQRDEFRRMMIVKYPEYFI